MRLIDADALIEEYDRVHVGPPGKARKLMEDATTIEPEPKTGHWIHKLRHYASEDKQFDYYEESCSVCGAEARFWWRNFKYCPMCGAKMEEVNDETD